MEMAPRPAPIAANAHRPIILRAGLPVSARRAATICTFMSNLFVCRCEEDARLPLRHDFSKGETCYDCSSLTGLVRIRSELAREHECHRTGVEVEHRSRIQRLAVGPDDTLLVERHQLAALQEFAEGTRAAGFPICSPGSPTKFQPDLRTATKFH
jgi:hypothetical protein